MRGKMKKSAAEKPSTTFLSNQEEPKKHKPMTASASQISKITPNVPGVAQRLFVQRFLMVGISQDGKFNDIDDRTQTPRLADLNSRYMATITSEERAENEAAFAGIMVQNKQERLLLKAAKELRLVLPKYFRS